MSVYTCKSCLSPTIVICTNECCVFVVLDERGLSVHDVFHLNQACVFVHGQPACGVNNYSIPGDKKRLSQKRCKCYASDMITTKMLHDGAFTHRIIWITFCWYLLYNVIFVLLGGNLSYSHFILHSWTTEMVTTEFNHDYCFIIT